MIGSNRVEGANGDGHNIVHGQVGEDQQIATQFSHPAAAFLAELFEKVIMNSLNVRFGRLAEERDTLGNWSTPGGYILQHAVPIAQVLAFSSGKTARRADPLVFEERHVGLVRWPQMIAINAVFR